jgi:hypothetical protein
MIILKKNSIWFDTEFKDQKSQKVDTVIPFLGETIKIDKNFTLGDFFKIIEKDIPMYETVFSHSLGHFSLQPFINDLKKKVKIKKDKVKVIEISWAADQWKYKNTNEISIDTNVCGYTTIKKIKNKMAYGLDFSPLNELKNLPLYLNTDFEIFEWGDQGMENESKPLVKGTLEFTVYDVFTAILNEISFMGLPKNRDEELKKLKETVRECKEQIKNKKLDNKNDRS